MLGGRINKSPTGEAITVIFGTNADEMALFIAAAGVTFPGATLPLTTDDLSIAAKHLVSYHRPSWNDSMINTILEAYTGSAWKNAFPAWKLTGMGTDFVFLCPMRLAATALSNHGINVYVYLYDFKDTKYQRPGSLLCQLESEVGCGVQHSDELKYVFGRGLRNGTETTVSDNIQTWWTNLAIHGTPTTAGAAVVWPTYTSANPNVMVISENPTVVRGDPPNSRCSVWDALPLV
jgi:carboxylesterase type B